MRELRLLAGEPFPEHLDDGCRNHVGVVDIGAEQVKVEAGEPAGLLEGPFTEKFPRDVAANPGGCHDLSGGVV